LGSNRTGSADIRSSSHVYNVGWIRNFAIRNFAPKIHFVFREIFSLEWKKEFEKWKLLAKLKKCEISHSLTLIIINLKHWKRRHFERLCPAVVIKGTLA
jgi:hypothetical protein